MPVDKKQNTTPDHLKGKTTETASSKMPTQEDFHHSLRAEIRTATRIVMEEVMREELSGFLGASWGETSVERKGYRNGSYTRDLMTATGRIEDLSVPRDREGQFHTQAARTLQSLRAPGSSGSDRDVCERHEYPESGGSGSNAHGCGSECQYDQQTQPDPDPAI